MSAAISLVPLCEVEPTYPPNGRRLTLVADHHRGVHTLSISDVLDLYLQRCDLTVLDLGARLGVRPLAQSTIGYYRSAAKNLRRFLPDPAGDATDLDPLTVQATVTAISLDRGPFAGQSACNFLRAAFTWAKKSRALRGLEGLPTDLVETAKTRRRRDTHMPIETVRALYWAAGESGRAGGISMVCSRAIRFSFLSGLRRDDVCGLRVEHFDKLQRCLLPRIEKSDRYEILPLSDDAFALLEECEADSRGGWLFPSRTHPGKHIANFYGPWDRVLAKVGVDGHKIRDQRGELFVPHMTRHAFISHNLAAGIAPISIAGAVGQTDWQSVGFYASASLPGKREAADTFARLLRGPEHMEPKGTVGDRFEYAMRAKGLTFEKFAAKMDEAGSSIGPRQLRNYADGTSQIPNDRMPVICRLLGVSADYLLGVRGGS